MENLARYIIRASFSQERMQYLADEGTDIYTAKDGKDREVIKTILKHLDLWLIRSRPPAKAHAPPAREYAVDDAIQTDFPAIAAYGDPDYSWNAYITQ